MMLCGDGDPSQPDLVTIWIYLDRGQSEHSLNGFCMPKCVKALLLYITSQTTGKQAVRCKDLESDVDVDLLIELLFASQSDFSQAS